MSESDTASAVETAPLSGSDALASLSDSDRAHWQMTGELPASQPAESTPHDDEPNDEPQPDADPEPTDAQAKPDWQIRQEKREAAGLSKRQQERNELIRSRVEAEQRAADLEARLAALEKPAPVTEPAKPVAAAVPAEKFLDFDQWIAQPDNGEKDYGDYIDARARHVLAVERAAERAEAKAQEAQTAQSEKIATFIQRRDAFAATEPDFNAQALPFLKAVRPSTPLYDTLIDSPVGPQLAWHLVTHPEDFTRIGALNPIQQLRELGKLEARLDPTESPRTSASAGPAAKHVTTAPVPPTTLSARSADPADPLDAALKDRDFRRYEAEANARDLKSRR